MDLGNRIKAIREDKRLRMSEVADILGVDVSNYAKIEKKGKKLSLERVESIADALGVPVMELLGSHYRELNQNEAALHDRIKTLEQNIEELKSKNQELSKENGLLNDSLSFVKGLMNLVNNNPQQIEQLEKELFKGDNQQKENFKQKTFDLIKQEKSKSSKNIQLPKK